MTTRLPSLNALRAFEAVARQGSLTSAAKELCVTHGAVSRHISILEDTLGVKLFIRGPRTLELTPAARDYFNSIRQAFDMVRAATSVIALRNDVAPLKIKGIQTFILRWLIPRIQDLDGGALDLSYIQSGHSVDPDRDDESSRPVDFERDDTDISIEAFPSPLPDTTSYKLIEFELVPICNPHRVNGKPPPRGLVDIVDYTLLCPGRALSTDPEHNLWQFWLKSAGLDEAYRLNCSYFSTFDLIFRAAAEGMGIGMGIECFLEKELSSGTLMIPFKFSARIAVPYYLIIPNAKKDWPRVVAFKEWITAKADAEGALMQVPANAAD